MDYEQAADRSLSPFLRFSREEWGRLRAITSLSVSEDDVRDLRRITGHLSLEEATEVYLPSRGSCTSSQAPRKTYTGERKLSWPRRR